MLRTGDDSLEKSTGCRLCGCQISRTQAALLADAMAERLGIKEKWKVFEGLWNRKNMRGDYTRAMNQQQSLSFQDKLKRLFSTDNEETVAKYKIIG